MSCAEVWIFCRYSASKRFSSHNLHFWKASHAPCIGKLTAEYILWFTSSPSLDSLNTFTWTRGHLYLQRKKRRHYSSSSGYSAPRSRIAEMEIQVFRNEKSSQTNAYSHYSNYSSSGLIPNERALSEVCHDLFVVVSLRRRAKARNVSFRISLRWPIHIINPADKTKLSRYTSHRRSTTVSLETYPSIDHELVSVSVAFAYAW